MSADPGNDCQYPEQRLRRRPVLRPQQPHQWDNLPDVRDGLSHTQRIVLWQLGELEKELGDRTVPTAMLYGRVVEQGIRITPQELSHLLGQMGAMKRNA